MSEAEPPVPAGSKGDPVRRWTLIVAGALLGLLALQIASDRTAPVTSIGTVEGLVLPIAPRVSGELLRVFVQDNEVVEAGQPLAEIDPTPFELAVQAAQAELERVGQSLGASTAEVAAAAAKLVEAQAVQTNKRAQAERTLTLVERGAVPVARGDDARADVATADATVAAAEADFRRAEQALGPIGENNPQLRAAQSALKTAQFNLGQTRILAPTKGRVTNFSLGAGQTATVGQPILSMIDLRGAWIIAWFRENQLGNIKPGDRANIVLDVLPGAVWPGAVESFSGGIDTINQATSPGGLIQTPINGNFMASPQRFGVRLRFDPPDSFPFGARLGSQATVMVQSEEARWLRPVWWLTIRARALISYVY